MRPRSLVAVPMMKVDPVGMVVRERLVAVPVPMLA
jgi:hypothetical protein